MCVGYETNILYDGKVVRSTRRVQKNIKILFCNPSDLNILQLLFVKTFFLFTKNIKLSVFSCGHILYVFFPKKLERS